MAEFNLREMPEDKFREFVTSLQSSPLPSQSQALPESVSTETRGALTRSQAAVGQMEDTLGPEARRMGVREGAFLDISKGAPASVRWKMGLDENQLNQFKELTDHYGPGNVDLSDDGRFIVRGQKEDFLVDPVGFDSGDVAQIGAQSGPILAGALGARLGLRGKSGVGKVVLGSLGAAGTSAFTGATQDAFVRWLNDNDANLPEIGKRRAQQAIADSILGIAAAGGTKMMSKMTEGFVGALQIPAGTKTGTQKAASELFEKTGVKYPLTPGQAAESDVLLKVENVAGGRVGSSGAFDRIKQQQQNAENELRRVFLGLPRTMGDEELMAALPRSDLTGQRALQGLGKEVGRVEGAVASATDDILKTGTEEAQQLARVNLASPLVSAEVGKVARARAVREFDQFHGSMGERYEEFLSRPEIQSRTTQGGNLAKKAAELEKKYVPDKEEIVSREVQDVDAYGSPITRTRIDKEVTSLDAFAPTKFNGFINQLKGLKNAKTSVNSLKQIRTSIDNAIKEGISIPGTDVSSLNALKGAVEDEIGSALKGLDDSSLLPTWNSLRGDYAKGMDRFNRKGIRELLITEGERGSLGDTKIVESFIGNSPEAADQYNALKSFYGASSPEFEAMKQVARERALKGALSESTGYVDGIRLSKSLQNLRPEIAEELFGVEKAELHRIGEVLAKAQGKLDTDEILKLAQSKSLTAQKVSALQAAEAERTKAYNNKLIRAAAKGVLGEEAIKPSEFVRHALSMDPSQAAKVVAGLSDDPEVLGEIRQLAIEDLWGRVRTGKIGQERISATALEKALGDKAQAETWRTIIGDDTLDSLRTLVKTISIKEKDVSNFSGKLGGQSDIANLALKGEVGTLKEAASRYLLGFLYASPMKRMVTNLATANDRSRLLNAVIASEPFIGEMIDRFGSDGAFAAMSELRDFVEPLQRKELFIQGQLQGEDAAGMDPSQLSKEEFKRWLSNSAQ